MATSPLTHNDLEKKYINAQHNYISQKVDSVAIGLDALDIGTVFVLTAEATLQRILEETAKFILFPIAALLNIFRAIISWRDAAANKGKNGTGFNAFVETVAAVGITIAVVGGLAFSYIFAPITPIIFASVMAFKTLANGLASAFYWGKYFASNDTESKHIYKTKGTMYAGAAAVTLFAGLAVTSVMILLQSYMSFLGMLAGVTGVGVAIYKWRHSNKPVPPNAEKEKQDDYDDEIIDSQQLSSTALLQPTLQQANDDVIIPEEKETTSMWTDNQYLQKRLKQFGATNPTLAEPTSSNENKMRKTFNSL